MPSSFYTSRFSPESFELFFMQVAGLLA